MGIKSLIDKTYAGIVKVKNKYDIDIVGTGRNTEDLVKFTIEGIEKSKSLGELPYGNVWVVFDKDDFTNEQFNNAILEAEKNNYKVAWSNEAIELWFLLHFEYLQSSIHRYQYIDKLNQHFNKNRLGKYEKNLDNIFEILKEKGSLKDAISNAQKLRDLHEKTGNKNPSERNPCTTVDMLVEELLDIIK